LTLPLHNILTLLLFLSFFAKYDFKFTDADKDGVIPTFRKLEDVEFLKRGFRPFPRSTVGFSNLMLAPVVLDTINNCAHWYRKMHDERTMAIELSHEAARLAFTRGPDFYNKFCNKMRAVWIEFGETFTVPSWRELAIRTYKNNVPLLAIAYKHLARVRLIEKVEGLPDAPN